jgi:hypothetical protein
MMSGHIVTVNQRTGIVERAEYVAPHEERRPERATLEDEARTREKQLQLLGELGVSRRAIEGFRLDPSGLSLFLARRLAREKRRAS